MSQTKGFMKVAGSSEKKLFKKVKFSSISETQQVTIQKLLRPEFINSSNCHFLSRQPEFSLYEMSGCQSSLQTICLQCHRPYLGHHPTNASGHQPTISGHF